MHRRPHAKLDPTKIFTVSPHSSHWLPRLLEVDWSPLFRRPCLGSSSEDVLPVALVLTILSTMESGGVLCAG
ncbi:hypothetical protein SK128_006588, partial [Halocaridina rubra]